MSQTYLKTNMQRPWLWFFWTIATALSWALVVYPGLNLRNLSISSWPTLLGIAWSLFLSTLALGLFVGVFQYLVLRYYTPISVEWIIISTFSYAFGSALSLLVIGAWVGTTWPDVLSGDGIAFLPFPLALTMLLGGALTGLFQAYAAKRKYAFIFQNRRKILLWALATALSWGLGFFATGYAWDENLPIFIRSGFLGLIIGAITGAVLLLQLEQKPTS